MAYLPTCKYCIGIYRNMTHLSYGYDWSVRWVFAFETATSVRKVSELGLRSVLLLITRTLAPMMEKMGSGLTLLWGPGESSRKVFLTTTGQHSCVAKCLTPGSRIEVDVHVGTSDADAVVANIPVEGHLLRRRVDCHKVRGELDLW